MLPGRGNILNPVSQLIPLDDVTGIVLLRAELTFRTGDCPQEVLLALVKAVRVVGGGRDLAEHFFASSGLVEHRPVAVVLEEVTAIKNRKCDRLRL